MGRFAAAAVVAVAAVAGTTGAQGFEEVASSPHNVFSPAAVAKGAMPCTACHVDDESADRAPLWDPKNARRSFSLNHSAVPSSGKAGPTTRPFGPSYECLSCHDGALGGNVHQLGYSGPKPVADPEAVSTRMTGLLPTDHPDSITYPRSSDGRLLSNNPSPTLRRYWSIPDRDENGVILPTGPRSAYLNLQNIDPDDPAQTSTLVRTYQGVIHCDSCHNPHSDRTRPFLRVPHKTLCLVCHDR